MGLLDGKQILVTGVLTDASIAFAVARAAQSEGAEVVLSGAGRGLSLTRRTARKLPLEAEVLEIDVTDPAKIDAAAEQLGEKWDRMDGLVHAIAYAPPECLGGGMFVADWEQVQVAFFQVAGGTATAVGSSVVKKSCNTDTQSESFSVDAGVSFNRVVLTPITATGGGASDLSLSEMASCLEGVSCVTSLASSGHSCP